MAHIRPKLLDLVSPLQTAFVPGRNGVDNAIIVQELIHSMSKKKGRSGIMAIEIDLEKAYDRLGWSFIRDTLKLFELPDSLIALIMSCVSTSTISVLFNRGALESFQPSRGVRQGDPFSPYLFILCMEVLGAMINEKCNEKLWNPIKASQGGLAFSNLFFADDLVLFAKANRKNCVAVKEVIDTFCSLPSQKVSATKTKVFFSPNVPIENRESLCEVLGFRSTPNLGKYLGLPIKHTPPLKITDSSLKGYKASCQVGKPTYSPLRVDWCLPNQLHQLSLTTICNVSFPPKILLNVDRISRNFLWGSSDSKRKFHMVEWKKITKPKKERGLGL